ncbi:MAG: nitrilase-related carbon-nitrogen hydrolase [Leptospirales bacterium]
MIKVALVQNGPTFGDVSGNLSRVRSLLATRREPSLDLVVLPELFSSGYQFISRQEAMDLGEYDGTGGEKPGETVAFLKDLSRETGGWVVGGVPLRRGDRVFNSSIVANEGTIRAIYDKTHLFEAENRWFDQGEGPLCLVETPFGTMGVMICFDWLFPEVSRTLALGGATIIAHPVNWVLPFGPQGMILRSVENRVYSVTANRVGEESRGGLPPLRYIGSSQVVSPGGKILARASGVSEELLELSFDPDLALDKRVVEESDFFRQRRTDLYAR